MSEVLEPANAGEKRFARLRAALRRVPVLSGGDDMSPTTPVLGVFAMCACKECRIVKEAF